MHTCTQTAPLSTHHQHHKRQQNGTHQTPNSCNNTTNAPLPDIELTRHHGVLYGQNVTRVHDTPLNSISSQPQARHRLHWPWQSQALGTCTWVSLHRECKSSVPFTAALSQTQHKLSNISNILCTEFYPQNVRQIYEKTAKILLLSWCAVMWLSGHTDWHTVHSYRLQLHGALCTGRHFKTTH